MGYCEHDAKEKRPLRVTGFDVPQMVCGRCWREAVADGRVKR